MKKTLILAAVSATFASAAYAQSSVTLYGIVDAGFTFVNNQVKPGLVPVGAPPLHGAVYGLKSGNVQNSRWGLRGAEDLGGGLKAIFTLESGFDIGNGTAAQNGRMFGRQAFVGMSSPYGTVTLGRQYDSVVDYIGPLTATGSWGGTYFAHPFDNDNANNSLRMNNSVKFQSANYGGFSFGGLYAFSNQAGGFASDRAYSAGMGYQAGGLKLAAAYLQTQGTDRNTSGAVQDGIANFGSATAPAFSSKQRTWGAGGSYAFGPATVGAVFSQSRFQFVLGDASVRLNNYEVNARYNLTPAFALGAAYTYTQSMQRTPAIPSGSSHWNQFGLQADYALSKRTDIYAEGVAQLGAKGNAANGTTTRVFGTDAPSSSRNQVVVTTGIRHRF
ncbi:porin [Paraburkholderia bonniea]|uniref:porin n=1 Tax=Paraburkholderia bonniea TaxID=2152891 RepID=UPI0012920369|nr:porin [Paraburkholderia bonniea]WJF90679.1 porin [Paraburkholderia bonniea]WJF93992.1 porin [Paraburkholderia bonniea]